MGKKSTLTAEQRTQLVLRLLGKEEPAAQIARRAGTLGADAVSLARGVHRGRQAGNAEPGGTRKTIVQKPPGTHL